MAGPWERYQQPTVQQGPWSRYQSQQAVPMPGAEMPEEPGVMDAILGGLSSAGSMADQAARGVAQGVTTIAGLPADVGRLSQQGVSWGAERLGASPETADMIGRAANPIGELQPYIGGEALSDSLDAANEVTTTLLGMDSPDQTPDNMAERYVNRVGHELGATALPVAGLASAGQRLGVEGAKQLPGLSRFFVEPFARNPQRAVGTEAAFATAAGAGGQTAREMNPDSDVGDLIGSLAGAGALGAGYFVAPAARSVTGALFGSDRFADDVVRSAVTDELIGNSTMVPRVEGQPTDAQELVNAITEASPISGTIPGYRESLADRTGDAGIANLEYGRQSGPNAGLYTERTGANTEAVDRTVDGLRPTGREGALGEELALERNRRLTDANVMTENARQRLDDAMARLETSTTAEGRGAGVRGALNDALEAAREVETQAWSEVSGQVDPAPLAQRFQGVTDNLTVSERRMVSDAEGAISTPQQLLPDDTAQAVGAATDLREITTLRSDLTDRIRSAQSGGQRNAARILNRYVEAIDDYVESATPAALRDQYEAARQVSFDLNERFTRAGSPVAEVLRTNEGRPRVPDSAVAPRFVQPDRGQASNVDALLRETDSDVVRTAIRDQLIDTVARPSSSGARAVDSPERLNAFLQNYEQVFDRFPELRQDLGTAAGLRRELQATEAAERELTDLLTNSNRSAVAQYLTYGNDRAEDAMRSVLRSRDPSQRMDELLSFVGDDPAALEGARKTFWNVMETESRRAGETTMTQAGSQPWMAQKWGRFLDRNSGAMDRLYQDAPEHISSLREIAEALQTVDTRLRARAPNSSGTAQAMRGGGRDQTLSPATVQSRIYEVQRGRIGLPFFVTSLVTTAGRRAVGSQRERAFNRLLDDSLLDPDKARFLLEEYNPANRAAASRKLRTWYGSRASTLIDALSEGEDPEEEDQTMDAITRPDAT